MRTRTALPAVLLAVAAFTAACSSDSGSTDTKPSSPDTATVSPTPTVDEAQALQDCVDAVAAIPADDNGEVPSEPVPDECSTLSSGDYLDAYMAGIAQGNQDARDALQDAADAASEAAQP